MSLATDIKMEDTLQPIASTSASANGDSKPTTNGKDPKVDDEDEDEDKMPEDATETLYIQNLNEKVKMPVLKESLLNLFKSYRPLTPVIAHRNMRMRGQAFINFHDRETADKARREVKGFPLYGKPMVIKFAKTRSDVVFQKLHPESTDLLEQHLKDRKERKKITRKTNPLRVKAVAKYKAAAAEATATGVPMPTATRRTQIQMPDEYLPPNKVLFLQNLPEGTTKEDLQDVFEQHPNLLEVRLIPNKRDIAFVEYADEGSATVAKDALHNFKIDGETKMKVTYARK